MLAVVLCPSDDLNGLSITVCVCVLDDIWYFDRICVIETVLRDGLGQQRQDPRPQLQR